MEYRKWLIGLLAAARAAVAPAVLALLLSIPVAAEVARDVCHGLVARGLLVAGL